MQLCKTIADRYTKLMRLKKLTLEGFRNYKDLELSFETELTALVGLNAQGKTNLLESIAFLALGKSFRAHRSVEALHWESPHGRIKGLVEDQGTETELEVFFQRNPESKKVKKANKVCAPKNFLGSLRVVLFTPDQLDLVSGSPSGRRQFLDRLLMQVNGGYVEAFSQVQKILDQRNALLKKIAHSGADLWELELWDARLAEEAQKVWSKRKAFVAFIQEKLATDYALISENKDQLELQYETHQENFDQLLIAHRDQDLRTGSTSVGPHRDDFTLILNGKPLKEMGSRGECRSAILALKKEELQYMQHMTGEKPLLLLDDVFSELDENRQLALGELLEGHQSILTTTALDHVKGLKNARIYQVDAGKLLA